MAGSTAYYCEVSMSANTVVCFMNNRILAMVGMHVSRSTENIAVAFRGQLVIAGCRMNVLTICGWQAVVLSVKNECSVVKKNECVIVQTRPVITTSVGQPSSENQILG
jgi:hypothetical protein